MKAWRADAWASWNGNTSGINSGTALYLQPLASMYRRAPSSYPSFTIKLIFMVISSGSKRESNSVLGTTEMKDCLVSYPCHLWSQENHGPLWTVGALPQYKNWHHYFQVMGAATVSCQNDKQNQHCGVVLLPPGIVLSVLAGSRDIRALTSLSSSFKMHQRKYW